MDESGPGSTGGNDFAVGLRELTVRLATHVEAYEEAADPPRVHAGRLPEDSPVAVPIPEGATVVGSVVRRLPRGRKHTEVVIDVPQTADGFREDYRRQLRASGWEEDADRPEHRGFNPRGLPLLFRAAYRFPRLRGRLGLDRPELPPVFRLGARLPKLMVFAQDRRDAPTDVRLHLFTGHRDPWVAHDPAWTAIPSLISPPGVHGRPAAQDTGVLTQPFDARAAGGGWGGPPGHDGAYSFVVLETTLDLDAIVAHYAEQLEGAGWSRADGGRSGPQAWSTWTFDDEGGRSWDGTFTALRLAGFPQRYLLQVHAGLQQARA